MLFCRREVLKILWTKRKYDNKKRRKQYKTQYINVDTKVIKVTCCYIDLIHYNLCSNELWCRWQLKNIHRTRLDTFCTKKTVFGHWNMYTTKSIFRRWKQYYSFTLFWKLTSFRAVFLSDVIINQWYKLGLHSTYFRIIINHTLEQ